MKILPQQRDGFTLIELMVVIAIIGVLSAVVITSVSQAKSKSRDAQVRSDLQLLKLAFVRYRESGASPTYSYPSTSGVWKCLKTSGTCWSAPTYSFDAAATSNISPYFPGGVVPKPPGTKSGEFRFDSYLYANPIVPTSGYQSGAYIVWPQESPISNADCRGWNRGLLSDGIYYCYERLPD